MTDWIPAAMAQGAPQAGGPKEGFLGFLPLLAMIAVFFVLFIWPQIRRQRQQRKMIDSLAKGDEIITTGGMAGRIVEMGEPFLEVEIADRTVVRIQKSAVGTVLPKGTLKLP